jgi:hypothetical protein
MARRPRHPDEVLSLPPDEVLSRSVQRRLSMMSVTAVEDFYRAAHHNCRLDPGNFPNAKQVQEFVQPPIFGLPEGQI